jgi:hypothetical protein
MFIISVEYVVLSFDPNLFNVFAFIVTYVSNVIELLTG